MLQVIIEYLDDATPADIDVDLCIVGGGPAGIAIAESFIGSALRVCLIESGGLVGDPLHQSLASGASIGTHALDPGTSRMRVFGGSCNLWGGGCIPLGDFDMAPRAWVPHSGWPIGYADLAPHYERARAFCRLESHAFEQGGFLTRPVRTPLRLDDRMLVHHTFARSPILFGDAYRAALAHAPNVQVLLHANILSLQASPDAGSVQEAHVGSLSGRRVRVRARHYVLACGGIENARLLLLSDSVAQGGLGNDRDLVGRYFMDHPSALLGTLRSPSPDLLPRRYERKLGRARAHAFPEICIADGAMRAHAMLGARVRPFAIEGPVPKGLRAMRELRESLHASKRDAAGSLERNLLRAMKNDEPLGPLGLDADQQHLARLALRVGLGAGDIAVAFARKVARRPAVRSEHVSLVGYFEQAPNPDSRVTLGHETDALGQRKVRVEWRLTDLDRHTYRTATRLFGGELARASRSAFTPEPWLEEGCDAVPAVRGTAHHLGTTRMSDDPRTGVVDRDCRVHGVDNLHVIGSSVFPTGGWAFPTFTIIALSLRLAEQLRTRLQDLSVLVA